MGRPKKQMTEKLEHELIDNLVEEPEANDIVKASLNYPDTKVDPRPGEDDWEDFVLSKLLPKERDKNGYPTTAGLRRIAPRLLGKFIKSAPISVVEPCQANDHRATVIYEIEYLDKHAFLDDDENRDPYLRHEHKRTWVAETADAWEHNIDGEFAKYPTAVASTRAEGRALRKALLLSTAVSEELSEKEAIPTVLCQDGTVTSAQIHAVDLACKALNINAVKLVHWAKYEKIEEMPRTRVKEMLKALNDYKSDETKVPEKIKGYQPDWRGTP